MNKSIQKIFYLLREAVNLYANPSFTVWKINFRSSGRIVYPTAMQILHSHFYFLKFYSKAFILITREANLYTQ